MLLFIRYARLISLRRFNRFFCHYFTSIRVSIPQRAQRVLYACYCTRCVPCCIIDLVTNTLRLLRATKNNEYVADNDKLALYLFGRQPRSKC